MQQGPLYSPWLSHYCLAFLLHVALFIVRVRKWFTKRGLRVWISINSMLPSKFLRNVSLCPCCIFFVYYTSSYCNILGNSTADTDYIHLRSKRVQNHLSYIYPTNSSLPLKGATCPCALTNSLYLNISEYITSTCSWVRPPTLAFLRYYAGY